MTNRVIEDLRKDVTTAAGLSDPKAGVSNLHTKAQSNVGRLFESLKHPLFGKVLVEGKSKEAFSENVRTEMAAGKPQDQAVAIAYAERERAKK